MTLTDEQLEQAAREFALIRLKASNRSQCSEQWMLPLVEEIRRWLQMQEAVNRVVGK